MEALKHTMSSHYTPIHLGGSTDGLFNIVESITGVDRETLLSRNRAHFIATARHLFCWIGMERMGLTCVTLGKALGRDHCAVLNGRNRIAEATSGEAAAWRESAINDWDIGRHRKPEGLADREESSAARADVLTTRLADLEVSILALQETLKPMISLFTSLTQLTQLSKTS